MGRNVNCNCKEKNFVLPSKQCTAMSWLFFRWLAMQSEIVSEECSNIWLPRKIQTDVRWVCYFWEMSILFFRRYESPDDLIHNWADASKNLPLLAPGYAWYGSWHHAFAGNSLSQDRCQTFVRENDKLQAGPMDKPDMEQKIRCYLPTKS